MKYVVFLYLFKDFLYKSMCYIFYKTSYESSIQKAELWDYHLRIAMSNARFLVSL